MNQLLNYTPLKKFFRSEFIDVYHVIPRKYSYQAFIIIFSIFLSAILETLTLITIKPIITFLTESSSVDLQKRIIEISILNFGFAINIQFLLIFSIIITTAGIIIRWLSLKYSNLHAQKVGLFLSQKILVALIISPEDKINKDYEGADSITALTSVQIDYVVNCLNSQFAFINAIFTLTIISIGLLILNPVSTGFIILSLMTFYILSASITKPYIKKNGLTIKNNTSKAIKDALNLYYNKYFLKINKNILHASKEFYKSNYYRREAAHNNYLLSNTPRLILDYFIYILIPLTTIVFFITSAQYSYLKNLLPGLILLGLAMQRLLPSVNQGYRQWSRIKWMYPTLKRIINIIKSSENLEFYDSYSEVKYIKVDKKIVKNNITLNNISYKNIKNDLILKNCNLKINKGDNICILGQSGSGKTTLVKIICGLIKPHSGNIKIDGENIVKYASFNNNPKNILDVSYLPQNYNIIQGTILENITLFSDKDSIDFEILNKILEDTLCFEFISDLPDGINQLIGDNSNFKLSGGQIQRIAIARALYKRASLLIFDEGTNALDKEKESIIISNIIKNYECIFLMITHRSETKELFTKSILVKDKTIVYQS